MEDMLREAEQMLQELKDRDFDDASNRAEDELDKAVDGKCQVQVLMVTTLMKQVTKLDNADDGKAELTTYQYQEFVNTSNLAYDNLIKAVDGTQEI